jgi:hypothetical protein
VGDLQSCEGEPLVAQDRSDSVDICEFEFGLWDELVLRLDGLLPAGDALGRDHVESWLATGLAERESCDPQRSQ